MKTKTETTYLIGIERAGIWEKPLHTIPSEPNKLFWDSKHSHVQPAPSAELKILFFFFTPHQTAHIHTLNYTLVYFLLEENYG